MQKPTLYIYVYISAKCRTQYGDCVQGTVQDAYSIPLTSTVALLVGKIKGICEILSSQKQSVQINAFVMYCPAHPLLHKGCPEASLCICRVRLDGAKIGKKRHCLQIFPRKNDSVVKIGRGWCGYLPRLQGFWLHDAFQERAQHVVGGGGVVLSVADGGSQ